MIIFCISTFVFIAILLKSKNLEILQRNYVRKIFLSVNDYNCQQCVEYFKKVSLIFIQTMDRTEDKFMDQAKNLEKKIVNEGMLNKIYQNFKV